MSIAIFSAESSLLWFKIHLEWDLILYFHQKVIYLSIKGILWVKITLKISDMSLFLIKLQWKMIFFTILNWMTPKIRRNNNMETMVNNFLKILPSELICFNFNLILYIFSKQDWKIMKNKKNLHHYPNFKRKLPFLFFFVYILPYPLYLYF